MYKMSSLASLWDHLQPMISVSCHPRSSSPSLGLSLRATGRERASSHNCYTIHLQMGDSVHLSNGHTATGNNSSIMHDLYQDRVPWGQLGSKLLESGATLDLLPATQEQQQQHQHQHNSVASPSPSPSPSFARSPKKPCVDASSSSSWNPADNDPYIYVHVGVCACTAPQHHVVQLREQGKLSSGPSTLLT